MVCFPVINIFLQKNYHWHDSAAHCQFVKVCSNRVEVLGTDPRFWQNRFNSSRMIVFLHTNMIKKPISSIVSIKNILFTMYSNEAIFSTGTTKNSDVVVIIQFMIIRMNSMINNFRYRLNLQIYKYISFIFSKPLYNWLWKLCWNKHILINKWCII